MPKQKKKKIKPEDMVSHQSCKVLVYRTYTVLTRRNTTYRQVFTITGTYSCLWASLVAKMVKDPPAMWET